LRAQILQVVPTLPLARVLLRTNPPITALMLHRDLDGQVTLPAHALRIIETGNPA
jgi:hypothetical protein